MYTRLYTALVKGKGILYVLYYSMLTVVDGVAGNDTTVTQKKTNLIRKVK